MEFLGNERLLEMPIDEKIEVHDPKGVETDPTPPTAMEVTTAARSNDKRMQRNDRLDNVYTEINVRICMI